MNSLRSVLAIVIAICLSGVAKADDFQMVIIDPLPAPAEINFITNPNFAVSLSPCHADQLNGASTSLYLGCFTGLNDTGTTLTSIQIDIPLFDLNGQQDSPNCAIVAGSIFSSCSYSTTSTDYVLTFTGGNLPTAPVANGDCDHDGDGEGKGFNSDDVKCNAASIFTIAVGVGQDCGTEKQCKADLAAIDNGFNQGTSAVVSSTPEPASLMLLSTGMLSLGLVGAYRRRHMHALTRKL